MKKIFTAIVLMISVYSHAQNGVIWYDPVTVADKTYGNLHPRVVLDKEHHPLVLWGDQNGNAYIAKWKMNSFEQPAQINVPGHPVFTESWAGPEITNRSDTMYIVYKEMPEDKGHVFLKHSYDGGKTYSIETQVDDSSNYISRFPTVAIDPYGHPLVAYLRLDPGFTNPRFIVAKSRDLGESFVGEALVENYSGGKVSDCSPATVVESGNATAVLFRDNFNDLRNIWAGISTNTGVSFKRGVQIDQTNWMSKACPAQPPHGIIISDTLYTVYMSGAGDSALVYLGKTSVTNLSPSYKPLTGSFTGLASQNYPRISNAGDATAIVWEQYVAGNSQICMLFTNDISAGFPQKPEKIASGMPANADVALAAGHIYVVWQDDSSGNIMCRVGSYKETIANKLLAENTTITLERAKSGKYFLVPLSDMASCMMVDAQGREFEMLDVKCKKNGCKVFTEELDAGMYIVKIFGKDEKIYTYKYEVRDVKEKEKKEKE